MTMPTVIGLGAIGGQSYERSLMLCLYCLRAQMSILDCSNDSYMSAIAVACIMSNSRLSNRTA